MESADAYLFQPQKVRKYRAGVRVRKSTSKPKSEVDT